MARMKRTYTPAQHDENWREFTRLQSAGEAIPDELYYWFNEATRRENYISEGQAQGMYTYLINHNEIASGEASAAQEIADE